MHELLKSEKFIKGLYLGININQRMILNAHERNEPLMVDGKLYYILSEQELLKQMLDSICDG